MLTHDELSAAPQVHPARRAAGQAPIGLLAQAGNKAVGSLLSVLAGHRAAPPVVQRSCGCGGGSAGRGSPGPQVASLQEDGSGEPEGAAPVCLTCAALRAAASAPGGALAYVGAGPGMGALSSAASTVRRPVGTEPVEETDDTDPSLAGGLAADQVSGEGDAGAGDLASEESDEAVAAPATRPDATVPGRGGPTPPPVMVPVDASRAGAAVVCRGNNRYEVWMNPSSGACVQSCMRRHEEKHIADFNADANYKATVKCASLPDGETFTYASNADAARFECAASDVEIACINEQLKTEKDETCKKTLTRRATVTMPNYKKGFGC